MQHDAAWLRHYLVAEVEDPRTNLQSVLSRHFLVRSLFGDRFTAIMKQEYQFAASMAWLRRFAFSASDEERECVLFSLSRGCDSAEGTIIPAFLVKTFRTFPVSVEGVSI